MDESRNSERLLLLFCSFCLLLAVWQTGHAQEETSKDIGFAETVEGAQHLVGQGRYGEAETLARQLLVEAEERHGADSLEVAKVLDPLVEALWRSGKSKDPASKELALRAVGIKEKTLGPEHPHVAKSLNNLANLVYVMGEYAGARPLYERALSIREKALGPEHPDVATSQHNLASLLMKSGDHAGARRLYERALAIREKALGRDHADVAKSMRGLALLLQAMGDYAGARPFAERALAIRLRALGPEHPDVAESLSNLAVLLWYLGGYAGADPCMSAPSRYGKRPWVPSTTKWPGT